MSVQEHNKQLCRDYFQAFLARDTAWMARHIAPEFVRHDPGLPFEVRGPKGVAELHDALLPAFPDMALPLLDTDSHLTLLAGLVQPAEQLQAGNYKGLNGVACRVLMGARGIGKTNLARAFTAACTKGNLGNLSYPFTSRPLTSMRAAPSTN